MSNVVCPSCGGAEKTPCLVHTENGCRWENLECGTCGATGFVTEEFMARRELGKKIRAAREFLDRSCMEQAKRLGVKVADLIGMESGRLEPSTELLKDLGLEANNE